LVTAVNKLDEGKMQIKHQSLTDTFNIPMMDQFTEHTTLKPKHRRCSH